MRIISGEFRHRKLFSPPDAVITRPIPDRVKEALFSLLRGWTEGAVVVDVFAGSGAIGLEAVSRGAAECVFFEKDRRIADILQRNIDMLGCTDRCTVMRGDALGPALLSRAPKGADLMFFDPPYALVQDPAGWDRVKTQFVRAMELMKEKRFAVLRTPWPFRHRVGGGGGVEQAPVEEETPRGRRRRDAEPEEEEKIWEGEDLRELEEGGYAAAMDDDEGEDGGEEEEGWEEDQEQPVGHWEMVDLTMPGADGPETHVYGSTAIHLYMRKPGASE